GEARQPGRPVGLKFDLGWLRLLHAVDDRLLRIALALSRERLLQLALAEGSGGALTQLDVGLYAVVCLVVRAGADHRRTKGGWHEHLRTVELALRGGLEDRRAQGLVIH